MSSPTRTTFCPSCQTDQPATAFLCPPGPDPAGAFLRCRPCIRADRLARHFVAEHRAQARRSPASAIAVQVRAAREVAARNVQAARIYADRFPALPDLVAA